MCIDVKAAGWRFKDEFDHSTAKKQHEVNLGRKMKVADLLRDFLVQHRGLEEKI